MQFWNEIHDSEPRRQGITTIDAFIANVRDALVNPDAIRRYMFGTTVVSTWRKGEPIVWKRRSRRAGELPHGRHRALEDGGRVRVALTQYGNPTAEAREHSERNWSTMRASLKEMLEA